MCLGLRLVLFLSSSSFIFSSYPLSSLWGMCRGWETFSSMHLGEILVQVNSDCFNLMRMGWHLCLSPLPQLQVDWGSSCPQSPKLTAKKYYVSNRFCFNNSNNCISYLKYNPVRLVRWVSGTESTLWTKVRICIGIPITHVKRGTWGGGL